MMTDELQKTLSSLQLITSSDLIAVIVKHIKDEIVAASKSAKNWSWDDDESSCAGVGIRDPDGEAVSAWCGTLVLCELSMRIDYAFAVRWDGEQGVDISYYGGCRDGDVGRIDVDDGIVCLLDMAGLIDLRDICWEAGADVSTPGLEEAVLAVCAAGDE